MSKLIRKTAASPIAVAHPPFQSSGFTLHVSHPSQRRMHSSAVGARQTNDAQCIHPIYKLYSGLQAHVWRKSGSSCTASAPHQGSLGPVESAPSPFTPTVYRSVNLCLCTSRPYAQHTDVATHPEEQAHAILAVAIKRIQCCQQWTRTSCVFNAGKPREIPDPQMNWTRHFGHGKGNKWKEGKGMRCIHQHPDEKWANEPSL